MRMKRFVCLLLSCVCIVSALYGCQSGSAVPGNEVNARAVIAGFEKDESGMPLLVRTSEQGGTYSFNGRRTAVWGVENDQWHTVGKNRANYHKYLEGSAYINANTIALHCPWTVMEPQKDVYDFSDFDYYLEQTRKAGNFKLVLYYTSTNYAAGDITFIPDYIKADTETYSRVEIEEMEGFASIPMCLADPDTLEREQIMVKKFFEHLKEVNTDGIILAVNIASEVDFMHDLHTSADMDIRCHCANCEAIYTPDKGNLEFMKEVFAEYNKNIIHTAADTYNIPIYTPVAPYNYWPDWRFVEEPDYIKAVVNLDNHVMCPSTATTMYAELYRDEMDKFVAIDGNIAFASGIDTGWVGIPFNNQLHLEIAPWITIFEYDGLGAIYWDHPELSVTKTDSIREKLRTGWGPLLAAEYFISHIKGDSRVVTAWMYDKLEHEADLGNFHMKATQKDDRNNGYAILVDSTELAISATTFKEEVTTVTVTLPAEPDSYTYETGYYDANGNWVKAGDFVPTTEGNNVTIQISGDSGEYQSCVYRICGK